MSSRVRGVSFRLRGRDEWIFFAELARASSGLAAAWWTLLVLRGGLPALFAIAIGALVGAVDRGDSLLAPLALVGVVFVLLQTLGPLHHAVSANLGSRMASWLYERLTQSCVEPAGVAHLEDAELRQDLTMARDFDLGITAPPLSISMDFVASGLVELVAGISSAAVLAAYRWWAPFLVGGAWLSTQWLLRESGVYRDRNTTEVRQAQRYADYAFRLAVDAPAAKELRLFGLVSWVLDGFRAYRTRLFDLRWEATRLRERSLTTSVAIVLLANLVVFGAMAQDVVAGALSIDQVVTFASAAVGASLIAFGGLSWALDSASAPAGAVKRLEPAMRDRGALSRVSDSRVSDARVSVAHARAVPRASGGLAPGEPAAPRAAAAGAHEIRFRDVSFRYPGAAAPVLSGFSLHVPRGTSLAIVGQNGAGKTTLAKLLCRLYDPETGSIEIDGEPLETWDVEEWRDRLAVVFQDFLRLELPLRDNVAPRGAPEAKVLAALEQAGARGLASLETILARGYPGGTDLSGGQWQRVALARALCAVSLGAGVVLLDEPTAQLDVRGESEIFDRLLGATQDATTILISHRFSTVRHVDRICVLEHGRVVELGSHAELMEQNGRYCEMFELQAARFERPEVSGAPTLPERRT